MHVAPEQLQHARVFHVALELPEQEVVVDAGVVAFDVGAEDELLAVEVFGHGAHGGDGW